jgi:hypothetical protein
MRNYVFNRSMLLALTLLFFDGEVFGQLKTNYWENFQMGPHAVGHRKIVVIDPNRTFDYTLGDSTVEIQNKPAGRPILLNIYFPSKNAKGGKDLTIKDLWQFSGVSEAKHFYKLFQGYEAEMAKMYAIDENLRIQDYSQDTTAYRSTLDKLFDAYASTRLFSKDGLKPLHDQLPVIIYHQGLGGTFDENLLLLEFLASHGFLVISSGFVNGYGTYPPGVGDTDASLLDIDFVIEYVKSNLSKSTQVFLTGHSFGANTIFTYPTVGKHKVTAIAPLDSDYGYSYYYHMKKMQQPYLDNQTNYVDLPIFAAGRSEAHFRMMDLLDKSKRHFLKVTNFKHNDFCSQTIIGAAYCFPYSKNQEQIQWITNCYVELCHHLLTFFQATSTNQGMEIAVGQTDTSKMTLEYIPSGKRSSLNSIFDRGKGKCPSNSQLLSLIQTEGMEAAGKEWLNCGKVKDTAYFDYDWLSVYDALLNDSSTERAIDFLRWFAEHRVDNLNLGGFAFYTYEKSFSDYGDGFHLYKANDIFSWMTKNLPNEIEGHKGIIMSKRVAEYYATEAEKAKFKEELIVSCKEFLTRFPEYLQLPIDNQWDETIQQIIQKNTESK